MYAPGGSTSARYERELPFKVHVLDAALIPPGDGTAQPEGVVHKSTINGWTVYTFWDRSADSRYSSNSAFALDGEWADVRLALVAARDVFPEIFARFPFQLTYPHPPHDPILTPCPTPPNSGSTPTASPTNGSANPG